MNWYSKYVSVKGQIVVKTCQSWSNDERELIKIPEITTEELQKAIKRLKKGKAADSNGIRAEDIKAL